jgi:hypothetical protein
MACFIDTMQPLTPAEERAWRFYLRLHTKLWRAARAMFRRACQGEQPGANLFRFVSDTGMTDATLLAELKEVLQALAARSTNDSTA